MRRTETRHVPVTLTNKELLAKGSLVAQGVEELKKLEHEKKKSAEHFADLMKDKRGEMDRLAHEIKTGEEVRPVECHLSPCWSDFAWEIVRPDTGEVVETRPMTERERALHQQPSLPLMEPEPLTEPSSH